MAYPDDVCTIFLLQFCITESVVILKSIEGKGVNDIIPKDSTYLKRLEGARKVGKEGRRLCSEWLVQGTMSVL